MGPISLDIDIDAPRERVFDLISDLSLRPAWARELGDEYRLERLDPSGIGAAARYRVGAPGGLDYLETVITRADRPHTIVEHGRGGRADRVATRTVWELSGGEGDVTRVRLSFWTEQPSALRSLLDRRSGRWWRRRWKRALRGLREALESGRSLRPAVVVAGGDRQPIDSRP